ncbi:MAG: S41 family peptidase [Janthinobacterium lividum]
MAFLVISFQCSAGQAASHEPGASGKQWDTKDFRTPYQLNLSDTEKVAGLSELWAEAKFGFANFWHVPSLDWDRAYLDYLPRVTATRSTADYYKVLQQFYALLGDGHTGVNPPETLAGGRLALETALVEDRVLVTGSRDDTFDMQGIKPGDEIVAINRMPVKTWAEANVGPYVSASTPQDHDSRVYYRNLLRAPIGTEFTLQIRRGAGAASAHTFHVSGWTSRKVPLFVLKMLPGNIAYVALNGFDDDTAAKEWDKHWAELQRAKAIILDLRENGGGSDAVGAHILATLLNSKVATPHAESTRWIASYQAWGRPQTPERYDDESLSPDPERHYAGQVAMLTSERTFSAGEDMAAVFKTAHLGKIFGEPTGGSTGQPLSFDLPGGGSARVCTKHDSLPDGTEFVGVGILPDQVIRRTREDILTGHDRVLEAAVQEVTNR